jgi:hypothetical protein
MQEKKHIEGDEVTPHTLIRRFLHSRHAIDARLVLLSSGADDTGT